MAASDTEQRETTGTVYVYGIVRSGAIGKISAEGVGGAPVEQVEGTGLAALVSALPTAELRVKRRDLDRHLQVLEEVFEATTVLPCSFATVVSRDDVTNGLLVERRGELLSALDQLDGKVQMNVKATYVEEELLRDIVKSNPQVARLRTKPSGGAGFTGQLQLGELVAAAVAERRERDSDRLLHELADLADDVAVEPAQDNVIKGSFLVRRAGLRRFDRAIEDMARREQTLMQFGVIGPLPPTAFASRYAEI